jgi:hypothetical protein
MLGDGGILVDGDLGSDAMALPFIFRHTIFSTTKIHAHLRNFKSSYLNNYRSKKAHLDNLYLP